MTSPRILLYTLSVFQIVEANRYTHQEASQDLKAWEIATDLCLDRVGIPSPVSGGYGEYPHQMMSGGMPAREL